MNEPKKGIKGVVSKDRTGTFCQFAVEEVPRDAARFHMPDVAEPAQTPLTKKGKHAVCAGSLQDFRVDEFLLPRQ